MGHIIVNEGYLDVLWPDRNVDLQSKNGSLNSQNQWKSVVGNMAWFSLVARKAVPHCFLFSRKTCQNPRWLLATSRRFGPILFVSQFCWSTSHYWSVIQCSSMFHDHKYRYTPSCELSKSCKSLFRDGYGWNISKSYPTVGSCNVRNPMINKEFEDDILTTLIFVVIWIGPTTFYHNP